MATLHYGQAHEFAFDDRTLNHLRSVIISKLLQRESFPLTWEEGSTSRTIWISPEADLLFELDQSDPQSTALNHQWIEMMTAHANTPAGLRIVPEPGAAVEGQPVPTCESEFPPVTGTGPVQPESGD